MTIDELAKTIQDRITALNGEIASLEAARDQLSANGSAPATADKGARSGRAAANGSKPAARRRRTRPNTAKAGAQAEIVPAGKLEAMLAQYDGSTTAQLAELANGKPEQVLTLLREMESAGRARRTGERRGTRWHAITDEDRVRARAAELEKQSRSARTGVVTETETEAEAEKAA
jgi:hypothetical protein